MVAVERPTSRIQKRAAATRARIIRAAYDLFCDRGYRATTMEAIAEAADVAVQTVYFTFGTKDELLREVHGWTVLGDDPTPPAAQAWHVAAMREPDARQALAKLTAGVATLNARIAPMLPVFAAVRQEPAGEIYEMSKDLRRRDMRALVERLRSKTPLKRGMTRSEDVV